MPPTLATLTLSFFIQEPPFLNDRIAGLNGIGNVYYLQSSDNVRTCIILSYGLDLWLVPDLSNGDTTTCAMKIRGQLTYLMAAYFDINDDIALNPINDYLSEINRKKIPCHDRCTSLKLKHR